MTSQRLPADPLVRLMLFGRWVAAQKRLIVAIALCAVVAASLWVRVISPAGGVWSQDELSNMDGLPLSPRGVSPQVVEAGDRDREAFLQLQNDVARQPTPDLLDGEPSGGG